MYLTERFSVAVTTVLGMLALIFSGILEFNEVFSCFTSTHVMLVLGMIIIVESLLDSGITSKIGHLLFKIVKKSEKSFLIVVFLTAAVFSLFSTNAPLLANDVLELTDVQTMHFFTPFPIAASIVIVVVLCYWFFLYNLQVKFFDFEEPFLDMEMEEYEWFVVSFRSFGRAFKSASSAYRYAQI